MKNKHKRKNAMYTIRKRITLINAKYIYSSPLKSRRK